MTGADIHSVATLLGHKDLRMVARYQHLSNEFLSDAAGRSFRLKTQKFVTEITWPKELSSGRALSACN